MEMIGSGGVQEPHLCLCGGGRHDFWYTHLPAAVQDTSVQGPGFEFGMVPDRLIFCLRTARGPAQPQKPSVKDCNRRQQQGHFVSCRLHLQRL